MHKLKYMYLLTLKLGAFPCLVDPPFVIGIRHPLLFCIIAEMHYCETKELLETFDQEYHRLLVDYG